MARIPYPDQTTFPPKLREFLSQVPDLRNLQMLTYSTATVEHFMRQAQAQLTALELPERTRELVILTTAAVTGTEYELLQHAPISRSMGVSDEVRDEIERQDFDSPVLSEHDRVITRFAAEVVRSPLVSDEIFNAVRAFLSNREIVEALQLIGYYWSFGRVATVLQVELEPARGTSIVEAAQQAAE